MQPQTMLLQRVLEEIETLELFDKPSLGSIPMENGIAVQVTDAYDESRYFDKKALRVMTLTLFCRHSDQSLAYDTLCLIGNTLQYQRTYPVDGNGFQWLKTELLSGPKLVTEENIQNTYSAVLNITAYI